MSRIATTLGAGVLIAILSAVVTAPTLAADDDRTTGEQLAEQREVRDTIRDLLKEAGLVEFGPDHQDRIAQRFGLLIDAGVVDQERIRELIAAREAGELRDTLVDRARRVREVRREVLQAYLDELRVEAGDGAIKTAVAEGVVSVQELERLLRDEGIPFRPRYSLEPQARTAGQEND